MVREKRVLPPATASKLHWRRFGGVGVLCVLRVLNWPRSHSDLIGRCDIDSALELTHRDNV